MINKIISMFISIFTVFSLLITAIPVYAISSEPAITITVKADKEDAHPGDIVTYEVILGPVNNMVDGEFEFIIPEALTYVSADTSNIVKENFQGGWTETTKKFVVYGGNYTSSTDTILLTVTCEVNDTGIGSSYKVYLWDPFFCDKSGEDFELTDYEPGVSVEIKAKPVAIDSISLNKTSVDIKVGETFDLTATISPDNQNEGYVWKSDDETVARISGDAETVTVQGLKIGTTTITIAGKNGEVSASCTVNVACNHSWSENLINNDPAGHYYKCEYDYCSEKFEFTAHDSADKDCTTEDICSCGYVVSEAGKHTPVADDGDCTTAVKCVNCEKNAVEAKEHVAGEDDGDCTTAVKCVNCTKDAVEANADHVAGEDDGDCTTAVKCVNCTKDAVEANADHVAGEDDGDCSTAVKCVNCEKNAIEAGEHTPVADDGDCTTAVDCQVCEEIAIAAKTEHEAGEDDGDCTTAIKCVNCTKDAVEANADHVAGEDDGDCTTAVKCVNCEKNAVEAKEHVAGEDDGDCTTAVKCVNCEKNAIEANVQHEARKDDGDCTTAIKCEFCDQIVVEANTGHDFSGSWQNDKAEGHYHKCLDDNCNITDTIVDHIPNIPEATKEQDQVCDICGYIMATMKHVHVIKVLPGFAATCMYTGLTEGSECSDCGTTFVEQQIIPKLAHERGMTVVENIVLATPYYNGSYDFVVRCVNCSIELERRTIIVAYTGIQPAPVIPETPVVPEETPEEVHIHNYEDVDGFDPTCTEDGLTDGVICRDCGEALIDQDILPATGHKYAPFVVENMIEATATENGSYELVSECTVCGEELARIKIDLPATGEIENPDTADEKAPANALVIAVVLMASVTVVAVVAKKYFRVK